VSSSFKAVADRKDSSDKDSVAFETNALKSNSCELKNSFIKLSKTTFAGRLIGRGESIANIRVDIFCSRQRFF